MKADKRPWKHLRLVQNLLIAALSLSALLLLLQVASYEMGLDGSIASLSSQFSPPAATDQSPQHSTDLTGLPFPRSLMVTGDYGRSGHLLITEEDAGAQAAAALLREALGSAGSGAAVDEAAFRQALDRPGIYFDFIQTMPVSVLSGQYGVSFAHQFQASCLLLSVGAEDVVQLYFWDGSGAVQRYSTAVSAAGVSEAIASFEPNGAYFAYEEGEALSFLSPYAILCPSLRDVRLLTTSVPAALDMDSLLDRLDFNPHTQSRYPEADGTEVVVETPRTLRVQPDGTVIYTGGAEAASALYRVSAAGDLPTQVEAVLAVRQLLEVLLSGEDMGNAQLYFSGVTSSGGQTQVTFDYLVDGIPVYFADGGSAVEVEITETTITAFRLRCRQYTLAEDDYTPLPLPQALAAASVYGEGGDARLTLGYVDYGSGSVTPRWLLR